MAKVKHEEIPPVPPTPNHRMTVEMTSQEFRVFNIMCGRNRTVANHVFAQGSEDGDLLSVLLGGLYDF
jgi:hypothetical protein